MLSMLQVQGETFHSAGPDIFKEAAATGKSETWRFYSHPAVWRPTLVCFSIMFFFQATGFNTIIANTTLIFKESKIAIDEHVASGITGGVILLSCAVALVLSRLLPRKVLLLTSSTGACVNLALLGMYYYLRKTGPMNGLAWVPLVCMMAFIFFFMVGFGAIAWTVTAELLPSSARGKIYPFIVAFSWICNFCFGYSFTHIQDWLGSFAAFWAFSGLSLVGAVFITLLVPETKERSSEEIADFFYTETLLPTNSVGNNSGIRCI